MMNAALLPSPDRRLAAVGFVGGGNAGAGGEGGAYLGAGAGLAYLVSAVSHRSAGESLGGLAPPGGDGAATHGANGSGPAGAWAASGDCERAASADASQRRGAAGSAAGGVPASDARSPKSLPQPPQNRTVGLRCRPQRGQKLVLTC
jgi:hypothetical protein